MNISSAPESRSDIDDRSGGRGPDRSARVEFFIAVLLTVLAVGMRLWAAGTIGPLWRDEANSINLASETIPAPFLQHLQFDAFPVLWLLLLRGFTRVAGSGDGAIRALGFIISLGLPAALWWSLRQFRVRPLLAMAFCGVGPTFIIWAGVGNRAYGLGAALLALFFGSAWRAYRRNNLAGYIQAGAFALLAVHTMYLNSVWVGAILGALGVVALYHWKVRALMSLIAVGAVAGATMLVYLPVVNAIHQWSDLVIQPVSLSGLLRMFWQSAGGGWVLPSLLVLFIFVGAALFLRSPRDDAALFAASAIVLSTFATFVFLYALGYSTGVWHYAGLIVIWALSADVTLERFGKVRLLGALAAACAAMPAAQAAATTRLTNVDLIANYVASHAIAQDCVVITDWPVSVSFARYYRGIAPAWALPGIEDLRLHRYDLVKQKIMEPDAAGPLLNRITQTLQGGGRVWIVGPLPPVGAADASKILPVPAADSPREDWSVWRWKKAWQGLLSDWFVNEHANLRLISTAGARAINPLEDEELTLAEGKP